MGTFAPISMKCTQEQFEGIKPKLKEIGKIGDLLLSFENDYHYLVNNYNGNKLLFGISFCDGWNRTVYEEWNEEIFLKACGIEAESLEQQLQKAEAEVKRLQSLIEEKNKPKVNDWVWNIEEDILYQKSNNMYNQYEKKIKDQELIKLLEQEIKQL